MDRGRLVCVDYLRPKASRPGGVRFLIDCGTFTDLQLSSISLQDGEIDDYRFAALAEALALLSGPLRRRVPTSAARNAASTSKTAMVPGVHS